jgi:hypothetical protein
LLKKLTSYYRYFPYAALSILLALSVWLLHEYAAEFEEGGAASIVKDDQMYFDSLFRETDYLQRQYVEDQVKRSRQLW